MDSLLRRFNVVFMVISSTGMQSLEISSLNPIKIKPNEEVHLRICVNHLENGYTIGRTVKSGLISRRVKNFAPKALKI